MDDSDHLCNIRDLLWWTCARKVGWFSAVGDVGRGPLALLHLSLLPHFRRFPLRAMVRPRGLSNTSDVSSVLDQDQVCDFLRLRFTPRLVDSSLGVGEHVRLPGQDHSPRAQWRWQVSHSSLSALDLS